MSAGLSIREIETTGDQVARGGLREQVTSRILSAVFRGRFPSGKRLVVQRLAEAYGVSPTPVREALVEVAGMGIVQLVPNRGAVVLPFASQQVRELFQVRRILEVEAVRGACHFADPDVLKAILAELERLQSRAPDDAWDRASREVDTRLHGLIAESCGSQRLTAELKRYQILFRVLRDVTHARDASTNFSRTNDIPEHLAIARALLARDEGAAAAGMDFHLRNAVITELQLLFSDIGGEKRWGDT